MGRWQRAEHGAEIDNPFSHQRFTTSNPDFCTPAAESGLGQSIQSFIGENLNVIKMRLARKHRHAVTVVQVSMVGNGYPQVVDVSSDTVYQSHRVYSIRTLFRGEKWYPLSTSPCRMDSGGSCIQGNPCKGPRGL